MPGTGFEESLLRDNIKNMVNRKNGDSSGARLTRGGAEIHHMMHHQLNSLQEVQIPAIQSPDGLFPFMRGWDGPQES